LELRVSPQKAQLGRSSEQQREQQGPARNRRAARAELAFVFSNQKI
jgi:hypothetical protein